MGLVGFGDATARRSTIHAIDESVTFHPTIDGSCVGRYYRSTKNRRRPIGVIPMVDVSVVIELQGPRCWRAALCRSSSWHRAVRRDVPTTVADRESWQFQFGGWDRHDECPDDDFSSARMCRTVELVGNRDHRGPGRRVKFGRTETISRSIGTRPRMEACLRVSPTMCVTASRFPDLSS